MAIIEEVVDFVDMMNRACPIPGLPIAANTAKKIVDIIEQMNTKDGDFMDQLSSTIRTVVGSIYKDSLEIADKSEEVPSTLTEHIDSLIRLLEGVESRCRKMHSQGWLKRMICYESDKSAIRAMTGELLAAGEALQTQVTPANAPRVKTLEEKELPASSSKITQDTPRIDAQGKNVRIINSGRDKVYRNGVLESSTPRGPESNFSFGAGCDNVVVIDSGNNTTHTFTDMPSTSRIPSRGENFGATSTARFSGVMEADAAFQYQRNMRQFERDMRQFGSDIERDMLQMQRDITQICQRYEGVGGNVSINSGNVTTSRIIHWQ